MGIVFAILIFSLLIFLHELGHFVAAKAFGVQVNEFSMFMGPAIFRKQKGETLYTIRCIPIGGYCAMEGEDGDTDNPRAFVKAKVWKRFVILVSGAAMNLIAGFLIVVIVNCFTQIVMPQIADLRPGSALIQEGGLEVGDTLISIDGKEIVNTKDFSSVLSANPDKTVYDVVVSRNGQKVLLDDVLLVPTKFEADEHGKAGTFYGITWAVRHANFGEILSQSWKDCIYFAEMVWTGLDMLLSGEAGIKDMSGPVGIVTMMNDTANNAENAKSAVLQLLFFGGFISVNLGIMNMLPVPALDGGRVFALLVTAVIEKITRKKINPKYEGYIHAAGLVLLLILMAVVMFNDVFRIFTR